MSFLENVETGFTSAVQAVENVIGEGEKIAEEMKPVIPVAEQIIETVAPVTKPFIDAANAVASEVEEKAPEVVAEAKTVSADVMQVLDELIKDYMNLKTEFEVIKSKVNAHL